VITQLIIIRTFKSCIEHEPETTAHLKMALRHRREEESGSDQESEEHAAPRQTFVDEDGFAIIFFIHKSVKKRHQRRNLIHDIQV
jgi:hypothetical protein